MILTKRKGTKYVTRNVQYLLDTYRYKNISSSIAPPSRRQIMKKLIKLLFEMIFICWIVFTIVFLLIQLIPGDNTMVTQAKERGNPATIAAIEDLYGLNDPFITQYFTALGNVFNGSFGISGTTGTEVGPTMFQRLSISIQIGLIAIAFSILIGIPCGVFLARRKNFWSEMTIAVLSAIAFAIPTFVLGYIFMLINYSLGLPIIFDYGNAFMYLIPGLVIAIPIAFTYTRYLRNSIRDEYDQQYVQFARVKGINESRILWRHTFKKSLYPIATYFPMIVVAAFFGSITIEAVFGIPGAGQMLVDSVLENDQNAILALSVMYTLLIVFAYFIREILYIIIDPRARE